MVVGGSAGEDIDLEFIALFVLTHCLCGKSFSDTFGITRGCEARQT